MFRKLYWVFGNTVSSRCSYQGWAPIKLSNMASFPMVREGGDTPSNFVYLILTYFYNVFVMSIDNRSAKTTFLPININKTNIMSFE